MEEGKGIEWARVTERMWDRSLRALCSSSVALLFLFGLSVSLSSSVSVWLAACRYTFHCTAKQRKDKAACVAPIRSHRPLGLCASLICNRFGLI